MSQNFDNVLKQIRACRLCKKQLFETPQVLEPRPIVQLSPNARVLICGQAPGRKVYETGVPFNDASGDRLRDWMGINKETFYNPDKLAIMPMGFCYPGTAVKGGDLPPRPECAAAWHETALACMPNIKLTLVIGAYAIGRYIPKTNSKSGISSGQKKTLTATVYEGQEGFQNPEYPALGLLIPLPHPSPRNNLWLRKKPWFEAEVLPKLKQLVSQAQKS